MAAPTPLTEYQQSYHWRNKNCGPWAQEWVRRILPAIKIEGDGNTASVTSVTSVEGDCDLGQRKGKLLTIYDLQVSSKWTGSDGTNEFSGELKIPEFSHETIDGLSDYVFDISIDQSSKEADVFRAWLKNKLPGALEPKLNGFREDLLKAHGIFETPVGSGTSTPAAFKQGYSPAPPGEAHAKAIAAQKTKDEAGEKRGLKTVTVQLNAQLHASAADLWSLLTDAQRVPMWSRAQADITPEVGKKYTLFNGNVSGAIIAVDAPNKLVQSWQTKSPGWPSDHHGIMTITLDQGSDSTKVTFSLDGVPADKEGDISRALDAFYIRGLKQMGLGTIL
ncbi:uncharacterized protein CcaverHIS019_0210070 [Cutaneotrichosporon cavernicola]|uniref:Activator of Hsp90 ATPase AHSA1-like N-terminal domain-containing protein n=1 Tax=Cutaneotrichosporon cavernicola TaxID=279322 RepID=A0AA48L1H5_9TREE|nr:uncharacterized protein CcaverHIS019_0210070 [Cutaneotrichosporon cavernicola]BEI89645.1 hypothetical protein CcaverHIS019_0210070 [Cutaneotrichosporon cavernicola]BEI97416.1 hypothetical protein CcaverHIS631_0210050 [Cutaneotrichosporon cavernicola]BEJ05194.1 hypothetical protein CcaverHIS641_0210110 [Cutaneotrichosporon cavernicola]